MCGSRGDRGTGVAPSVLSLYIEPSTSLYFPSDATWVPVTWCVNATRVCCASLIVGLGKGIGNLLAVLQRRDEDEEGAAGDDQAEGSRRFVAIFVANSFLYVVEDQVHQRVVALERAHDFSAAVELDGDLLVHVLAEVEDIFLLGSLPAVSAAGAAARGSSPAAATAVMAASVAATAATAATAPVSRSLRHGVCVCGWVWMMAEI